jgi:hypothetical protein
VLSLPGSLFGRDASTTIPPFTIEPFFPFDGSVVEAMKASLSKVFGESCQEHRSWPKVMKKNRTEHRNPFRPKYLEASSP